MANVRYWTSKDGFTPGPCEWEAGFLVLDIPLSAWDDVTLTVQGVPLPLSVRHLGGKARVVADWPRSGPGRYHVHLSAPYDCQTVYEIRPAKMSNLSFETMLLDLERQLPASIAMSLQRMGGLAGIALIPPDQMTVLAEFIRLRRAVRGSLRRAGLNTVLRRIAGDPHRILQAEERWTPQERVRRPSNTKLTNAMTRPGNLTEAFLPRNLVDITSRHTVDVYENRLTLLFATIVARRLRRLARYVKGELLAATLQLQSELKLARQAARFLDEVTPLTFVPHQVSMVLLKRPEYRAMLEGYLELQRSVAVRLDSQLFENPLDNLPQLYQLWGWLQSIDLLLQVGADAGFTLVSTTLIHYGPGEVFVRIIPNGHTAVELLHPVSGTRIRLYPERTFSQATQIRSLSFSQRPDVTIEIERPGEPTELYLLDPKYKLDGELSGSIDSATEQVPEGQPKKTDIDKMHAYRDAIRDSADHRVVQYAAILYPGPEVRYGSGIEALRALPGHDEVLRSRLRAVLTRALLPVIGNIPDVLIPYERSIQH